MYNRCLRIANRLMRARSIEAIYVDGACEICAEIEAG